MKVIINYKKVDMSDDEKVYYDFLVKEFTTDGVKGDILFNDLFDVNGDGEITIIKPVSAVPWVIIFFLQQVMINQRLRKMDEFLEKNRS